MATVFVILSVASMFTGNLLAMRQKNVKRMLAYSSIAHMGYLLIPFLAGSSAALTAVTYYLVAYFLMIVGAFGIVSVLSPTARDADALRLYEGLAWREPWLAGMFTAILFSLAGMPLTVGFIGEFYLFAAGVQSGLWALSLLLAINSAIGLYYYLRVIVTIYAAPAEKAITVSPKSPLTAGMVLPILILLLVWLGIYPTPVLKIIERILTSAVLGG